MRPSLVPFTSATGTLCALALDHRDAMRNTYDRLGVRDVTEEIIRAAKQRIIETLGSRVSAILLDRAAAGLPRPSNLGLLMPLERPGHDTESGGRLNKLMDDFSPERAAELGAQGCKLLLYYRADHAATAQRQLQLTAESVSFCHRHGLALVVEPKVYCLVNEDEHDYELRFGELVVAAASDLARSGADLLKLQYPGNRALCERISEAATPLPWTLLGGDSDGATFAAQLLDACRGGACGFMAGRAIWSDALALAPIAQSDWLERHSQPLLDWLCDIAETHARRIV